MQFFDGLNAAREAVSKANATRAQAANAATEEAVRSICDDVRARGDEALLDAGRRFDCPTLQLDDLRVQNDEIEQAWHSLPDGAKGALERAASNIETYHKLQKPHDFTFQSPEGATLGARYTPVERAGIYAPNGRAAYPSTVLMLAIPARVAGVRDVVLATPSGKDGQAHPVILAAARVAGVSEIWKMGGAAAVAAFAYGTKRVPKVDKIAGPGSIYFTLAKKLVFGEVGVDGLYGPSEVAVVADQHQLQRAPQLAADLLAQAEHGGDSFVLFVSPSRAVCDAVQRELESQTRESPRARFALEALENSLLCCVSSMEEACALTSEAALEHVEIWSDNARRWSALVTQAGALFLNTPVPLGDYIIGPSHTLPTGGTARFASGVGVDTFLKRSSIVEAPREAISSLADDLETIALLEDLPGHAAATKRAAV
ncbi:histidinol dehydrogenase [Abditibacteriota bacterium]|nr:histidinol dehydrogenase [Abditibacteriota bacterium]